MRLISQDGCKDIPYDLAMLSISDCLRGGFYINAHITDSPPINMGLYSTEEKALKVVGMIKERYMCNVFWKEGVQKEANQYGEVGKDILIKFSYFQFPKDSEVKDA